MDRNELKKFIQQQKEAVYLHPVYQDLFQAPFFLFDPDYRKKNPSTYIYMSDHTGAQLHKVKLAKSFAAYNKYDILCKMQEVAKQLHSIIVPVRLLHWRRRQRFEKQYPHFQAAEYSYLMLPPDALNDKEKRAYIDYIRSLEWNQHLP